MAYAHYVAMLSRYLTILLLGASLLPGCAAPPRYLVETPHGNVRGFAPDRISDLAERFLSEREQVLELLPGTRQRDIELWLLDDTHSENFDRENIGGVTRQALTDSCALAGLLPAWVRNTRVILGANTSETTLAHELVHAYLGPDWDTLPPALEEGLADFVATTVHKHSTRRREHYTVLLGSGPVLRLVLSNGPRGAGTTPWSHVVPTPAEPLALRDILAMSGDRPWGSLDLLDTVWIYSAGHYIAERIIERIGFEGLRQLAVDAAARGLENVEPDRLLAAAGLDAGPLDRQDLTERQLVAVLNSTLQRDPALGLLSSLYERWGLAGETPSRCFERLGVGLAVGQRDPIPIDELPGFDVVTQTLSSTRARTILAEQGELRAGFPAAVVGAATR